MRFPSMLQHCWIGDKKGIQPWMLDVGLSVVTFDWNFARFIAPVITATSTILSSNKTV